MINLERTYLDSMYTYKGQTCFGHIVVAEGPTIEKAMANSAVFLMTQDGSEVCIGDVGELNQKDYELVLKELEQIAYSN